MSIHRIAMPVALLKESMDWLNRNTDCTMHDINVRYVTDSYGHTVRELIPEVQQWPMDADPIADYDAAWADPD